ncbi:MAG: hypothetical protein EXR01_00290 [Acetobacteraceae bacterium]|nr:hypothetical protein [Acetobacteraceae bacterium]
MIRLSTVICAGVAAVAGLYLYHVKYQTRLLDRAISQTSRAIDATRERTGVLRAEWTLMNDPERLAELAGQFLQLNTVTPKQFTTLADLSARLPAARALPALPPPDAITEEPASDAGEPVAEIPVPLAPPLGPARPQPPPAQMTRQSAPQSPPVIRTRTSDIRPSTPPVAPQPVSPSPVSQPIPLAPVITASALGMARGLAPPPISVSGQAVGRGDIQFIRGN